MILIYLSLAHLTNLTNGIHLSVSYNISHTLHQWSTDIVCHLSDELFTLPYYPYTHSSPQASHPFFFLSSPATIPFYHLFCTPQCNNQPCVISQSYSEGSSWKAIKVVDKLWVGGLVESDVSGALDYTVDFLFGCQTSETGLFRTQLADGIMGMSMDKDTLPYQLKKQPATSTKV